MIAITLLIALGLADATLYVTTAKPIPYFASVNEKTGNFTKVIQYPNTLIDGLWLETGVDTVNKQYSWFMQSAEGLRLTTIYLNELNYTVSPPLWKQRNPLCIQWDPTRQVVYQVSYSENSKGSLRELTSIDPNTWEVTVLYSWGYNDGLNFVQCAYDYNSETIYLSFQFFDSHKRPEGVKIEKFDVSLGNMRDTVNVTGGQYPLGWGYDYSSQTIYGLSHYSEENSWGFIALNPETGVSSIPGNKTFPSVGFSDGSCGGTFDMNSGLYYKTLNNDQQQSVVVSLDTQGNLVYMAPLAHGIASFGAM